MPVPLFDDLLRPFEFTISRILVTAHDVFAAAGLPAAGGVTWVAAIAALVVVVRCALLPLVVRQARMSQRLALAAPRLQEIRERYRGARDPDALARLRAETRAVYAETGARPAGLVPVLAQIPVLVALFRVLDAAAHGRPAGAVTVALAGQLAGASVAGASLADRIGAGGSASAVAVALVAISATASWLLQRRQLTSGSPSASLDGPAGTAQRLGVWLVPTLAVFSGLAFPVGVLVYFACTNLWSLAQQGVLLRWLPVPGSPAHDRKLARASSHGTAVGTGGSDG